jgi:isopropylmalate/homocitrate/citramalate synthase
VDLPARVEIGEVEPRDGLQSEATKVPTPEKIALVEALAGNPLNVRIERSLLVVPAAR